VDSTNTPREADLAVISSKTEAETMAVERILQGLKTERKTTPEVTLAEVRNPRRRCKEARVNMVAAATAETADTAVEVDTETVVTETTEATETVVVTVTEVVIVAMVAVEAAASTAQDLKFPLLMRAKIPKCSLTTSVSKLRQLRKLFTFTISITVFSIQTEIKE
jgi:hypothetical protein